VALIVETSMAYGRAILHGVAQYIRESGPWTVYLEHRSLQDDDPPWLQSWDGDGIIFGDVPPTSLLMGDLGLPAVNLNEQAEAEGAETGRRRFPPHVQSDHKAIGALAAQHLLERGFSYFAFFGYPDFSWSRRSFRGFSSAVQAAGFDCHLYRDAQRVSWNHHLPEWEAEVDGASRWIADLPKPLGLMACNDFRGLQALDACRRAGVAVPEEVAVIGADNEVLACELAYPPLSSVVPDCRLIGYKAAALLDQLMQGCRAPESTTEVAPLGVVTRQSTDVIAIADPSVAAALKYIREHACEGIDVKDVVYHVAVSRSVLQKRFRAALGRTIHEVIAGVRLRRVKELLVGTELSLPVIAERAGFTHPEYLSARFRKATGATLAAYRREHACRP
jgi:LacI family transcriptional regulator